MTDEEAQKLREERDRYRDLWLRASDDRDALDKKLSEMAEQIERHRDARDAAWSTVERWREMYEAAKAARAEERQAQDALLRLEIERLTGHAPKPRGRPPSWSPDGEAEVERMHRGGASIREIAAELHTSKTQVHRVIVRVRRQQAEAAERARLEAIAAGRSPAQRAESVAQKAVERRPIEDYDPSRAERGLEAIG